MDWFSVIGFILGIILGSLSGALVDRSLKNKSFMGRSYCISCKKNLRWYDLFPVLSFLIYRGKCRYCHNKIPKEVLFTEITLGILIGFLFWHSSGSFPGFENYFSLAQFVLDLIFKVFFVVILLILAITDLKKTLIPDRIVIPSLWIAFSSLLVLTGYKIFYLYLYLSNTEIGRFLLPPHSDYFYRHSFYHIQDLITTILVALGIGGFFLVIIILTKGKGMGGGDVKLGAFIGLGLGFPNAILALMLSFISGAVVALTLILFGRKSFGQTIPFGPFLVLGAIIAIFYGEQIINWYLGLRVV